jgi:hypothetical protein
MRLAQVSDPDQVCLMVLCDRIPAGFVKQVERMGGTFAPVGAGLWSGIMAGMLLRGIETREAYRVSPSEQLLYTFSRAYLTAPDGLLPLDGEQMRVYALLNQQVEQFRRKRGSMIIRDLDAAQKSYEEVLAEIVDQLPPELRLRGLRGLPPEEIAKALTLEQRLAGLPPEQRLAGLTPEQILGALSPEALEQLARTLRH